MSAIAIYRSLEKLLTLHQSLNSLARKKRELITENDTDSLSKLLNDEQKHLKAVEQCDRERASAVKDFLANKNMPNESATLTELIALADESERKQLDTVKDKLLLEVKSLREENQLNQQLIYQSLQFVNVSLDMFRPAQQDFNYEKPIPQPSKQGSRSMFDSKA